MHFAVIQFAYALMASTVMGITLTVICISTGHVPYTFDSWWIYLEVILSSFLNMCGQNLMTYANQYANPATVGLISYMGVLYNFIVDLLIFGVIFTKLQIIGVAICLSFSVAAAVYKIRKEKREAKLDSDYKNADDLQSETDQLNC